MPTLRHVLSAMNPGTTPEADCVLISSTSLYYHNWSLSTVTETWQTRCGIVHLMTINKIRWVTSSTGISIRTCGRRRSKWMASNFTAAIFLILVTLPLDSPLMVLHLFADRRSQHGQSLYTTSTFHPTFASIVNIFSALAWFLVPKNLKILTHFCGLQLRSS